MHFAASYADLRTLPDTAKCPTAPILLALYQLQPPEPPDFRLILVSRMIRTRQVCLAWLESFCLLARSLSIRTDSIGLTFGASFAIVVAKECKPLQRANRPRLDNDLMTIIGRFARSHASNLEASTSVDGLLNRHHPLVGQLVGGYF